MSAVALIQVLSIRGIDLRIEHGHLRAKAKPGTITEDIRDAIASSRQEIIAALAVIEGTVENVRAEPVATRDAWHREIVAMQRWAEMGNLPDPNQSLDFAALRRIVPYGVCLDCGAETIRDGRHWCHACEHPTNERKSA